jgi:phasin family protein
MPSFPTNSPLRSGLGMQFDMLTELTRRSCDAMRKLSELHLQFAQQIMQDSADASRSMLNCTDVFQLAAVAAQASGPAGEHLRHYQRQLFGLMNGVQLEISRSAQALAPEAGRYASAMASSLVQGTAQAADVFSHAIADGSAALGGDGARYTPRQPH